MFSNQNATSFIEITNLSQKLQNNSWNSTDLNLYNCKKQNTKRMKKNQINKNKNINIITIQGWEMVGLKSDVEGKEWMRLQIEKCWEDPWNYLIFTMSNAFGRRRRCEELGSSFSNEFRSIERKRTKDYRILDLEPTGDHVMWCRGATINKLSYVSLPQVLNYSLHSWVRRVKLKACPEPTSICY